MPDVCVRISAEIGRLFVCSDVKGYVQVRTPYLYPDGDVIDLFYQDDPSGVATISDLGETLRWLRMQSIGDRRTERQWRLIDDICQVTGVELYKNMLLARVREGESLADAVTRVAQACVRVSDIWFTLRSRLVETIHDEVADLLRERNVNFQSRARMVGRSQRSWTVDFLTRTAQQSTLVFLLATGSKSAAQRVVEHTVAGCVDMSHLKVGPEAHHFVSLFDDGLDIWTPDQFRQVEEVSALARWSNPDEFLELLAA